MDRKSGVTISHGKHTKASLIRRPKQFIEAWLSCFMVSALPLQLPLGSWDMDMAFAILSR
jgi:hypothetical protein